MTCSNRAFLPTDTRFRHRQPPATATQASIRPEYAFSSSLRRSRALYDPPRSPRTPSSCPSEGCQVTGQPSACLWIPFAFPSLSFVSLSAAGQGLRLPRGLSTSSIRAFYHHGHAYSSRPFTRYSNSDPSRSHARPSPPRPAAHARSVPTILSTNNLRTRAEGCKGSPSASAAFPHHGGRNGGA